MAFIPNLIILVIAGSVCIFLYFRFAREQFNMKTSVNILLSIVVILISVLLIIQNLAGSPAFSIGLALFLLGLINILELLK